MVTGTHCRKKNKRIDELCSVFIKRGMHVENKINLFERFVALNSLQFSRYMENKYFSNETDYISFQEFLKLQFTTLVFNHNENEVIK